MTIGFLLPVVVLATMAAGSGQSLADPRYLRFVGNSLTLAGAAAVVTVAGRGRWSASAPGCARGGRRGRWCSAPGSATRCRAG